MEDYSLVSYSTLDNTDEESVNDLLLIIDNSIQYGEDKEVRDRYPEVDVCLPVRFSNDNNLKFLKEMDDDDEERENGRIKT